MKDYFLKFVVSSITVAFTYFIGGNPAEMLANALLSMVLWSVIEGNNK